ncbi:hypothetical protein [Flavobacterium sp. YO12]|uniref:hypothetical protein n=1 Tax=Flavobacterium sp. YO12 TaxID=1920029 RepID=UPI00100B0030|nr:hypothetical protein [Flavobacterium sp. YO12]RXM43057.1 hypothetical protein BOW55_19755 [Flavobacterium sp. YO12]
MNGRKMAYVIFQLHKEFEIIDYSMNSHLLGRKHFVFALKEENNKNVIAGINKYFSPNDVSLLSSDYLNDNDYISIRKEINKILNQSELH